ncbi:hypothetical protein BGZ83_002044 [Gryganskiella cystojenkinii]|nr:hypothetical protein BGZ83_002044 [Gryganskiella cystojenkinii]
MLFHTSWFIVILGLVATDAMMIATDAIVSSSSSVTTAAHKGALGSTVLSSGLGFDKGRVQVHLQPGSSVQGWPSLLEIEVDTLEIGGLSMPSIQSVVENLKIGAKNFGNIAA